MMEQQQLEEVVTYYRRHYRQSSEIYGRFLWAIPTYSFYGRLNEFLTRVIKGIEESIYFRDGPVAYDLWFKIKVEKNHYHAYVCIDVGEVTIPITDHQGVIESENDLAVFEDELYGYALRTDAIPFCNQHISQQERPFHLHKPALASIKGHPYILQGEIKQTDSGPVFSLLFDGVNEIDPMFAGYPTSEKGTKYIPLEKIDFLTYIPAPPDEKLLDLDCVKFCGITIKMDWINYMYYHKLIRLEYVQK